MAASNQGNPETAQSVYEFNVNDIKGNEVSLEKYRGHVLIIVNVASKCGYTAKHYAELNEIYDQYAESKGEFEWLLFCGMKFCEIEKRRNLTPSILIFHQAKTINTNFEHVA